MADIEQEVREKMKRSITGEFVRLEDDFDTTRNHRSRLVNKLMEQAEKVSLVGENGAVSEDTDTGLRVISAALKALSETEKANVQSISMKLRHNEQAMAAAGATKDRINIVIEATKPGRIEETFPKESLEEHLAEMFDASIHDFELKTSPRDIDD